MEIQDVTSETASTTAVVKVREVPAAIEAREALLTAIAQEARTVVEKQPGGAGRPLAAHPGLQRSVHQQRADLY